MRCLCAAVAVTARRVMWSVRARAGDVIRVLLRHQLRGRLNPEWEVGVREGPALRGWNTTTVDEARA